MVRAGDREKVDSAIRSGRTITLTTCSYFADERGYIDAILDTFLKAGGRPEIHVTLSRCIHELADNAKKANTKRVYFNEKRLNIENESEYWIGMRTFRWETIEHIDYYLGKLKEAGLYIKVQFRVQGKSMLIAVRNNVKLTRIERGKIEEKIARSRSYAGIEDAFKAYSTIEDQSEGAGLGIVMLVMLLRNLNLGDGIVRFFSNESETFVLLTIPVAD